MNKEEHDSDADRRGRGEKDVTQVYLLTTEERKKTPGVSQVAYFCAKYIFSPQSAFTLRSMQKCNVLFAELNRSKN